MTKSTGRSLLAQVRPKACTVSATVKQNGVGNCSRDGRREAREEREIFVRCKVISQISSNSGKQRKHEIAK